MEFLADAILVLKNGDRLTGEIRQMNSGILDFKCDYGDNHFKIYWDQIKYLESNYLKREDNPQIRSLYLEAIGQVATPERQARSG